MNNTENKPKKENELSEEFFENIFSQAGDGIFLIDDQGRMVEMNPRGCEILGYTKEELQGKRVFDFQPADEIEHIAKKLAELSVEKIVTAESAFIRKDGSRVQVEITGKLLSNNQIIGMLRDSTERTRAQQALVESEQKFRSLVENSPDGITVVDENGRIIEWNRGQEEITGVKRASVIGKQVWDVQFQVLPEELQAGIVLEDLKQKTLDLLRSGNGPGLNQLSEKVFRLPDGTRRSVEIMTYSYRSMFGYHVGSITRDITRRKQVEMLLEYLAMHDPLTDLPNRQLFENRLNHALDRARRDPGKSLAVMMLDLDNFKEANDTYGHAYGDQLLRIVGQRLQNCLRKSDTAARMGGDEFALINEGITGAESVRAIASKVLQAVSSPVEIEGRSVQLTASIGISICSSQSQDLTLLLRQADIAMYQAKRTRNCFHFFSPS